VHSYYVLFNKREVFLKFLWFWINLANVTYICLFIFSFLIHDSTQSLETISVFYSDLNCYVVYLLLASPNRSACFVLAPHSWGLEVTHNDAYLMPTILLKGLRTAFTFWSAEITLVIWIRLNAIQAWNMKHYENSATERKFDAFGHTNGRTDSRYRVNRQSSWRCRRA